MSVVGRAEKFQSLTLGLDGTNPRFPWKPSVTMLTYRLIGTTEHFGINHDEPDQCPPQQARPTSATSAQSSRTTVRLRDGATLLTCCFSNSQHNVSVQTPRSVRGSKQASTPRMRDGEERDASLALRCGRGNRLRKAVGWYRNHDRLHTGDPIAMAADAATTAYITARAEGKDVAIICGTWEIADAINQRLDDGFTNPDAPSVAVARDQRVRAAISS